MSSSIEMNNEMTVNSLLMKSLESATREYARKCVTKLASEYGFSEENALKILNLENLKLQVQEMKKRSGGKAKAKESKAKESKAKPEKPEKKARALFALPFSKENVLESGCQGLAYNSGLFTQCPKECIASLNYCKQCQSEIDQYGGTTNGTVAHRLGCELMEFKDPKGRKPVAYSKIMEKQKLSREQVEAEAGKQNIVIDEIHFVAGEKKEKKKKAEAVSVAVEDDLLSQLLNDLEEDEESIDLEAEVALKKQQQAEVALKKQQQADEVALKKQQQADEKAAKEAEKAAKEAEKAEKAQKIADEKAALQSAKEAEVAQKKQQQADEKAAKAQQIADEKAAKAQQIADEKAAKAQQIADEKAAKAQQIADEKAAKEAEKAQKIAEEKAVKEKKIADEKALKKKQQEEKAPKKESKEKTPKENQKKTTPEKKPKEAEAEVVAEPVVAAPAKKVTVKRITIEGKQYLKTVENLLYDPETKEEIGIYDPVLNTIKSLPDDTEDELSEDDMSDDE